MFSSSTAALSSCTADGYRNQTLFKYVIVCESSSPRLELPMIKPCLGFLNFDHVIHLLVFLLDFECSSKTLAFSNYINS